LIRLNCHQLIILSLKTLRLYERSATLHFLIAVVIIELHFKGGEALIILFIVEQGTRCQQLKTDIMI
jgi:hypothetical protein